MKDGPALNHFQMFVGIGWNCLLEGLDTIGLNYLLQEIDSIGWNYFELQGGIGWDYSLV